MPFWKGVLCRVGGYLTWQWLPDKASLARFWMLKSLKWTCSERRGASPFRYLSAIEQCVMHVEVVLRSEERVVRLPVKYGGRDETRDLYVASDGRGWVIKLEERCLEDQGCGRF